MLQALRRNGGRELWPLLPTSLACWDWHRTPCNSSSSWPRTDILPSEKRSYIIYDRFSQDTRSFNKSFACLACPPTLATLQELQESKQRRKGAKDVAFAAEVLEHISVNKLCRQLEQESKLRIVIPLTELKQMIRGHGIADSEIDTDRIISALQTAGVILRYEGKIFLKTSEVADIVIRALPDTATEAKARIEEISAELAPLEAQRAQIERQARLWRGFVAWSGLVLMVAQLALFARLTYWELSWDVMEPVSYFTGQLVAYMGLTLFSHLAVMRSTLQMIGCYIYFLITHRDFGYEHHFEGLTQKQRRRLMTRTRFDEARYQHLKQEVSRWQRYSEGLATSRLAT